MTSNLNKRILLFLGLCIPSRALITYIAYKYLEFSSSFLIYIAYIISFAFITIYTFDLRKTGIETFNEPIWWNNLRPVHALLWFIFAITNLWYILAIDTSIGIVAFIIYHTLYYKFLTKSI